ncbi:ROK family protein [Paenibacillus sp. sgz302251]|uniref:ROK family protein n=1 Tax=Paenibacillus sp. sgz302251 TaxID=3414493 RepID=UPI003C7A2AA4
MSAITTAILKVIRQSQKPISKADLVRMTNYSLATVNEHTECLIRSNLVAEVERGPSTGGRKPILLSFNAELGYVIAIDLESTHARVGIADFNCNIVISESSRDIDVSLGPSAVLEKIKAIVFRLMEKHDIKRNQIKGIGMGVPGPVRYNSGITTSLAIMPGWENYQVRQFWIQHFDCPCFVDNNVNTMALAEQIINVNTDHPNIIYVKIGNGIGASIICNGQLYRGSTEYAGGIGHINIGHDQLCYCGNRGCLEAKAGGRAIAIRAEQMARSGQSELLKRMLDSKGKLTLSDVRKAVIESDAVAVELMRECGIIIGDVLAGLVNFFNPSLVYVGGAVSGVGDVLLASIRQSIYQHSLPLATRSLTIQHMSLGENAGIIGAAFLAVEETIFGNGLMDTKASLRSYNG